MIPKLRFKDDNGNDFPAWNTTVRLEEISAFITKGATPTTYGFEWQIKGIYFFRNDCIKNNIFVYGDYSYISEEANEFLKRSEIRGDDIVIAITGDIGKVGLVPRKIKKANINQHLARIRIVKDAIPYFVYSYLGSNEMQRNYRKIKTGLSMAQLSLSQIRETRIPVVSIMEQQKIAEFLMEMDRIIETKKETVVAWQERKKGVMQKIFSQEVRFKDEDGENFPDWKEKKISDIFFKIKDKNKDGKNQNVITNSAEYGLINQREFFEKDIAVDGKMENYTVIKTGDFVYNPRKSKQAPYGPFNCYQLEEEGIVSPLYTCLRPKGNADEKYLLWYFKSGSWYRFIYENGAQNGARHDRVGMTDSLMQETPVYLPQSLEEQQKIAAFLSALDDVINNYKETLTAWQELKKGLLQQIFV